MSKKNKRILLLFIMSIMICSIVYHNNVMVNRNSRSTSNYLSISSTHAPILIIGDGNFTTANGVKNETAYGTKDDPFIIELWEIATATNGIEIQDTRAYITIQHCEITRFDESGNGIYIKNATNVVIQNCTIIKHYSGIRVEDINDTIIFDNEINSPTWGILGINMFNCIIHFNHINGTGTAGIKGEMSDTCNLTNNHIENSRWAFSLWHVDDFNITKNYCHHNTESVVYFLYGCNKNNFSQNTFVRNYKYAFDLAMEQDNHIHHNDLSLNGLGGIGYTSGWTDTIHDNTYNHSNEMLMESLPIITYANSSTIFCRHIILAQFIANGHQHKLVFKIAYQRHLDGNATVHMKASVYTLDGYYTISSTGEYIFNVNTSYNISDYEAFDYKTDGVGFGETSYELYHFPMCAQNVSESLNATTLNISLFYDCWGSVWSSQKSDIFLMINIPKYQTSNGGPTQPTNSIPGFAFILVLGVLLVASEYYIGWKKKKEEGST